MRENSLRNIPPPDHESRDEPCRTELTRSDSDSSAVSVESSLQNGNATPGQSAEWTNEKHSAYLDFLEASFVQQLQGSMDLDGWRSQEHLWCPLSSKALSANASSSSGHVRASYLMVQRYGCWQKIKSEGIKPLYDNAAVDSQGRLENPWRHCSTSIGKLRKATTFHTQNHSMFCDEGFSFGEDMNNSCEPAGTSEQHLDCHQNVVGSTTEFSDQNFVDEDQGDKSSSSPIAKRSRTTAVDASKYDQVVPKTPNVSTVNRASPERVEPSHHELFPEHPQNITSSRSDMHYF